ncbi:MAG: hypothetical protein QOJ15_9059 [Bradyrhizobium sp.]|nr:hypothetical protein [Bradyrhizobium sp.]
MRRQARSSEIRDSVTQTNARWPAQVEFSVVLPYMSSMRLVALRRSE